jgi:hypothetical protein
MILPLTKLLSQETLAGLLMKKGIFTKEEFFEMVRVVKQEM